MQPKSLEPALVDLVRRAQRADAPSPEQLQRVAQKVSSLTGIVAGAGSDSTAQLATKADVGLESGTGSGSGGLFGTGTLGKLLLGTALAVVGGIALHAGLNVRPGTALSAAREPSAGGELSAARDSDRAVDNPPRARQADALPHVALAPPLHGPRAKRDAKPSTPATPRAVKLRPDRALPPPVDADEPRLPKTPAGSTAVNTDARLQRELERLQEVERALRGERPQQALKLLRSFNFTQLAPHAAALRIVALCDSGSRESGRELSRSLLHDVPSSPFAARIQRACR